MGRANQGLWARRLGAAVAAMCATSLTACGPFGGPDPKQELHDSLQKLRAVAAVELSGSASKDGTSFTFDLQLGSHGALKGGVNAGNLPLVALRSQGRLFVSGANYFQQQGQYTGTMWVFGVKDNATSLIEALTDLKGFTSSVEAAAGNVHKPDGTTSGGQQNVQLMSDGVTVTLAAGEDSKPVHIETGPGGRLNDGLSDLKLDLHYVSPPKVTSPATYINASQPDSFPTFLRPTEVIVFDACDDTGCSLSVSVQNLGGQVGVAGVTFMLSSGGTPLGSCSVNVPTLAHLASTSVSCRVSADLAAAGNSIQATEQVNNPSV